MFDISKADDTVDRTILLKELQKVVDHYEVYQIKILLYTKLTVSSELKEVIFLN